MRFVQYANENAGKRKATDLLGSFAKGLAVIEAFSAERQRLSISEAAVETGMDRATVRRCLLTLAELGYANYDSKYFSLTPRILRLGTACLATMPLPNIVQPYLDQLSQDIGQSTSVSILDDWEIVYVARAAQQRLMSISLMPGSRLPAYCTSMGRVMLAALPTLQAKDVLKRHPPVKRTPFSLTSATDIMQTLAMVKKNGFAINNQEIEVGLCSIAVPIFDSRGRLAGALNTGVAAVHEDANELRELYLHKLLAVQAALKPLLV
jgi:IclR family transcriptional regulator, pca regulon regulatory protein